MELPASIGNALERADGGYQVAFDSPDGRLDSWKAIAAYLGRDVSTVIRWEQEKSLPVHRVPGGRRRAVFALTKEIDAWLAGQMPATRSAEPEPGSAPVAARPRLRGRRVIAAGLLCAIATVAWVIGSIAPFGSLDADRLVFRLHQEIPVHSAYSVAVADVNRDGILDFVVTADHLSQLHTFLGQGNGMFRSAGWLATGQNPDSVVLVDITGDGLVDAIVSNRGADSISVFPGAPDGAFGDRVEYATGSTPRGLAAAVLDGTGTMGVVAPNFADASVMVYRSHGSVLGEPAEYATGANPYQVRVADLNADGVADLVISNTNESLAPGPESSLSVLLGVGDGTFRPRANYALGRGPSGIAVADLDGDGRLDLAVTGFREHVCFVLTGNGDGTFKTPVKIATGHAPVDVQAVDFDGDGVLDLVTANAHGHSLSLLRGRGDGTFERHTELPVGTYPKSIAVGDVNRDGRPDLVVANFRGNSIAVLLHTGWRAE